MNKRIISYLLIASFTFGQAPIIAADANPAETEQTKQNRFDQFKAGLKKFVDVPANEARFLFNWMGKKYNGIPTPKNDDQHAYRLLGGTVLAAAIIASLSVFVAGQLKKPKISFRKVDGDLKSAAVKNQDNENPDQNLAKAREAIQKGANINAFIEPHNNILHTALFHNSTAVAKFLIAQPRIDLNAKTRDDYFSPLSIAAQRGYLELLKALLDTKKVNVNARLKYGFTALDMAKYAEQNKEAVIEMLKNAGAKTKDELDANKWFKS